MSGDHENSKHLVLIARTTEDAIKNYMHIFAWRYSSYMLFQSNIQCRNHKGDS